ncbi:MAG TPA: response regulator transcription factor [Thermomicrobiales bacterium]|nr:response regulator transcription factor [Thermomicrobiales bacterium]
MLVDDHPGFRQGLRAIIEQHGRFRVVAEASCGYEAIQAAEQHRPDVILLDYHLPGVTGLVIAPILARRTPHSRIVFLSAYDTDQHIRDAMQAGAGAYVTKGQDVGELPHTMASVMMGNSPIVKCLAERASLAEHGPAPLDAWHDYSAINRDDGMALEPLTAREAAVLDCVVQGHRYRTSAENLFLSEATVKNHVTNILSKWGLTNRVHLFFLAISIGWVQIRPARGERPVIMDSPSS